MSEPTRALYAELAAAFPAVKLHPTTFTAAKLWGAYTNDRSFEQATDGRAWSELSREVVEAHSAALGYMNPDAFIAVLPAYLVVLGDAGNELPAFVLGELTRKEDFRDVFDARVAQMTTQQRSVIAVLLEQLANTQPFAQHYGAELAAAVTSWRAVDAGERS
ncbi:MAG: DUF6714 family protein [Kofleriaceae bacterium]